MCGFVSAGLSLVKRGKKILGLGNWRKNEREEMKIKKKKGDYMVVYEKKRNLERGERLEKEDALGELP